MRQNNCCKCSQRETAQTLEQADHHESKEDKKDPENLHYPGIEHQENQRETLDVCSKEEVADYLEEDKPEPESHEETMEGCSIDDGADPIENIEHSAETREHLIVCTDDVESEGGKENTIQMQI